MAGSQRQNAADGSTAVQAAGDVNISNGLSPAQMVEILSALSSHVQTLGDTAKKEVEERLKSFEASVLERFAKDDTTNSDAFRDPDFLAATLDAQKAYARSGDEGLQNVLTDLIAQRSKSEKRNRLSLTLNDAIAKVGSIPESDLNLLSMIFFFQHVQNNGVCNYQFLAEFISDTVVPILSNISTSDSAVSYLAAHGCLTPPIGIATQGSAYDILFKRYGYVITKGATEETLRGEFPDYDALVSKGLIVESPYDSRLRVFSQSGPQLEGLLAQVGIFGKYSDRYAEIIKDEKPSEAEFQAVMASHLPSIYVIFEKYDTPAIRNSRLTSVGIALAHANLANSPLRGADLSIWVTP